MNRDALIFTLTPAVVVACIIFKFWHRQHWTVAEIAGLILLIGGAVFMTVARIQLGNSFSIRPEARELVTHGIYSKIRNPVYVSGMILIAGAIPCLNRPQFFWILAIIIPLQVVRARAESKVLEERFGDAYRQYRAGTWF
jgi:protein-S-isoprenylcysteine O-methyltransferase Ste14